MLTEEFVKTNYLICCNLHQTAVMAYPADNYTDINFGWQLAEFFSLLLLFGCPMANFGPLSREQPHSPNVNQCNEFLYNF